MTYILIRTGLMLVSLAAVLVFCGGTYQQIKGQAKTNEEMKRVAENIRKANDLTTTTVQRMQPLVRTATALKNMNAGLTSTAQLLTEMNQGLHRVTNSERKIIANLTALNSTISSTSSEIKQVSAKNGQLVQFTGLMGRQVRTEYGSMKQMNRLTSTSIAEMQKLNRKFSILRVLP